MSAASTGAEIRRCNDLDRIVRVLGREHPHIVGEGWLARQLERHRIANALKSEQDVLEYCLVTLETAAGEPQCGMVVALPKPGAEAEFAAFGPAPMLFGFLFGFDEPAQFERVVAEIVALAKERGRQQLVGPFEATINYSSGLLAEEPAFPPGFMMPRNPLWWNEALAACGFERSEELYTYEIDIEGTGFRPIGLHVAERLGLRMHEMRVPFSQEERAAIREVFNSGWKDNWGFVPLDEGWTDGMMREFGPVLWPGLSLLVYQEDKPVGVAIAAPDIQEVLRDRPGPFALVARLWRFFVRRRARAIRIFILGMASDIHGSAAAASVVETIIENGKKTARRYGAPYLIVGWTLGSNRRINRMIRHWAPDAPRVVHSMWTMPLEPSDQADVAAGQ